MAKDKKSFILYCDQRGTWERLSDEQAGKLIKHVLAYVNDENPESDFITELAFEGIKRSLKADLQKYEQIKAKRIEAGRKGGKQTQANQANASFVKQTQANQAVSVTDTVSDNDIIKQGEDFVTFFKIYNKKMDLHKCEREWSDIDSSEHKKILLHVPKYVAATPDIKFRKKPLNYLKDRTWQDEDLPTNKTTETAGTWKPNLI
jgi:hypothetical protein